MTHIHSKFYCKQAHDAERERESDHFASCLAPLMDAVRQFLEAWDSRADVNDHVERIRKAMKESK